MIRNILLVCLIAGLVFLAGCTQSTPTVPATTIPPAPATTPVTQVPTVSPAIPETTIIPPSPPPAEADPADVSRIVFTRYSDSDFSMDYPSAWNVSVSAYTSYICSSTETARCYQDEIAAIGPFDFNENSKFIKPSRIVTFTSADGRRKVVSFTSDLRDNQNGKYRSDLGLERAKDQVTANFPDVGGSALGEYQYTSAGEGMSMSYTVTIPVNAKAYPLAYAIKNIVTVHRVYEFAFISDNEDMQEYRNLKDRIFRSIVTNDIV